MSRWRVLVFVGLLGLGAAAGARESRAAALTNAWDLAELYLHEDEYERAVAALLAYLRHEPQRLGLIEGRLLSLTKAERLGRGDHDAEGDLTPGARTAGLLQALDRAATAARKAGGQAAGGMLAAHVLLGSVALEAGQEEQALEAYAVIAPLSEAAPLIFQFASRCSAAGQHETAAEAYALFRAHGGDSPYRFQALLRQAEAEERAGHLERAAALYRQLADDFPGRPEAVEALQRAGQLCLSQGGDLEAARAAFEQVLALDRSGRLRTSAQQSLAECDLLAGDLEGARDRYEALLATGEDALPAAHFGLAQIALYQGRLDAVVAHGDSLVARHPAHELTNDALELQLLVDDFSQHAPALAAYARALLLERQGRRDEAREAWEWLTEYGPNDLRARSLLRRARSSRPPDSSMALYDQVLAAWPDTTFGLQARLGRAGVLERLGRLAEAQTEYERALLAFPESARAPEMRLEIQRLRRITGEEGAG